MTGKDGSISVVRVLAAAMGFFVLTAAIGWTVFFARDALFGLAREANHASASVKAPDVPPPPPDTTAMTPPLAPTTAPVPVPASYDRDARARRPASGSIGAARDDDAQDHTASAGRPSAHAS